ncbi:MAG: MarR family transcriptional regulator [Candidatus Kariarchaeaceae archaeon]
MNGISSSSIISLADQLPKSVRTYLRAQILHVLYLYQPVTKFSLIKIFGFKQSSVNRIVKEMMGDGLLAPSIGLYRLTQDGINASKIILRDMQFLEWALNWKQFSNYDEKPNISYLNE